MEVKPLKLMASLSALGIMVCMLLVAIDLKIKNDLVEAAKNLELSIGSYRAEIALHRGDSIPDLVRTGLHTDDKSDDESVLEMENLVATPATSSVRPVVRTPRNTSKRIQSRDKQV